MIRKLALSLFCVAVVTAAANADEIITQWNFNDSTANPSIGSGSISTIGDVTAAGFSSGSGSSDPTQPGLGYQTTPYPAQSTANATAGIQIDVDTTGFFNIHGSFDLRTSNTASRWYQIQYTLDGVNFNNLGDPNRMGTEANAGDRFHNLNTFSLAGISGANNNANFGLRVVSAFSPVAFTEVSSNTTYAANSAYEVARNTTSVYGGGTWRFDMVTISGTAIPEPTAFGLFCLAGLGGLSRRRRSL
jgi:hypothetical protein